MIREGKGGRWHKNQARKVSSGGLSRRRHTRILRFGKALFLFPKGKYAGVHVTISFQTVQKLFLPFRVCDIVHDEKETKQKPLGE